MRSILLGCSVLALTSCSILQDPVTQEAISTGGRVIAENRPDNPLDLVGWGYAVAAGALAVGGVYARKYLKKKPEPNA